MEWMDRWLSGVDGWIEVCLKNVSNCMSEGGREGEREE